MHIFRYLAVGDVRSLCHTSSKLDLKRCSAVRVLKDLIGYAMFVQLYTARDGTEVGSDLIPEKGPGDAKMKRTIYINVNASTAHHHWCTNTGTNANANRKRDSVLIASGPLYLHQSQIQATKVSVVC